MIKTSRNTVIVDFYEKKKVVGLAPKFVLVASMNKLIRIIYIHCAKMVVYLNNHFYYIRALSEY